MKPEKRRRFLKKATLVAGALGAGATWMNFETYFQAPMKTVFLWEKGSVNDQATEESERPRLDLYFPEQQHATHQKLIIICPGGGYYKLAEEKEGKKFAELFTEQGWVAAVLFYRHREHKHPAPFTDACRAIRMMRAQASEYNIDPDKIALMGFSAGGHLAASVGTQPHLYLDPMDDLAGKVSSRPDRLILAYPVISFKEFVHKGSVQNLLGDKVSDESLLLQLSNNRQVDSNTPATFLFHTADDPSVDVQNSLLFAQACLQHKVSVALHIYPKGPHGVGLGLQYPELKGWSEVLLKWIREW
ncbi:alpha/beta hydrolase fold domain-containing protein [Rapidithrix thailandica]|uniref:Alpha/beta hydrolase fold domain-containing protein n=1 Tax=Rapidithrix thailandica TaxID=413964 RepID=A0AAW9SG14_9BACT